MISWENRWNKSELTYEMRYVTDSLLSIVTFLFKSGYWSHSLAFNFFHLKFKDTWGWINNLYSLKAFRCNLKSYLYCCICFKIFCLILSKGSDVLTFGYDSDILYDVNKALFSVPLKCLFHKLSCGLFMKTSIILSKDCIVKQLYTLN